MDMIRRKKCPRLNVFGGTGQDLPSIFVSYGMITNQMVSLGEHSLGGYWGHALRLVPLLKYQGLFRGLKQARDVTPTKARPENHHNDLGLNHAAFGVVVQGLHQS